MLFNQYITLVRDRAAFTINEDARKAVRAVFETLSIRITRAQTEALALTLPLEIREYLSQRRPTESFGSDDFIRRVAEREGVDAVTAEVHTRAVLSVLAEFVPSVELLKTLDQVPKDIRTLFVLIEKA